MTITITLDHSDIVGTDSAEIETLFTILQAYAKVAKENKTVKKETEENKNLSASKEEKLPVENSVNRKEIETQIKKIALEGKDKNISAKIKAFIREYGCEKLSEIPDEKMVELLEKVKAL